MKINFTVPALLISLLTLLLLIAGCSKTSGTNGSNGSTGASGTFGTPPVIQNLSISGVPALPGATLTGTVGALSAQKLALNYTWTASNGWTIMSGGNSPTVTITAPADYSITGTAMVEVSDAQGKYAIGTIALSTEGNSLPVINSISATPSILVPNGTATAIVSAYDPNGDTLTYTWTVSSGWLITGYGQTATITAPLNYNSTGYITATVNDGSGGAVTATIVLSTIANEYPMITNITASPNPVNRGGVTAISVSATDPNWNTLTYNWTVPSGWIINSGQGTSQMNVTVPTNANNAMVYVTVINGSGDFAISSIPISIENLSPEISSISITPQPVTTSTSLVCNASDPDGDSLSYVWNIGGINVTTGSNATWVSPGISGNYNVIVTVGDGYGAFVTGTASVSISSTSPWPRSRNDMYSTGLSSVNTSSTTGALQWTATIGNWVQSSPAIGADGTIYVERDDGALYAITPQGGLKWSYTTLNESSDTLLIGADGTIYVGAMTSTGRGALYAITPNGGFKWSYTTGYEVEPEGIAADGTIYITGCYNLLAITPQGGLKWSYTTIPNGCMYDIAIGTDGTIYVGAEGQADTWGTGHLLAFTPDGGLLWSYTTTGNMISSSPAIGQDGTIYVCASQVTSRGWLGGALYAITPQGGLKWSYTTDTGGNEDGDVFSIAIGADGTIYVGSLDSNIYAFSSAGGLKWHYTVSGGIDTDPAIGADGTIYVTSSWGYLYALNPNGTLKWSYFTLDQSHGDPAIGADGTIYIDTYGGTLYALH